MSTVAAAFALGQYFGTTYAIGLNAANTGGDSFGSPNTTQGILGLTNAMATTFRLSDYTTGNAVTTQNVTGAAGTLTTTPEYQKLYTIANILASCVNTTGPGSTACGMLFGNVAPQTVNQTGTTAGNATATLPTNILQAAVYMSLNPTSTTMGFGANDNSQTSLGNLYTLQTPTAPFVGVGTQPNDWTLGILYSAPQTTTQTLINGANGINIDASGNVFIINYTSTTGAATGTTILGPTGAPLYSTVAFGSINTTTPNVLALRQIAVDLNGNGCATSSSTGGGLLCINSGTGATSYFAGTAQYYGIAVDGSNDIFVSHNSTSSNTYSFEEFLGGVLSANTQYRFPFDAANSLNQTATLLTNGNLVETAGSSARATVLIASNINTGTCTTPGPCTATPVGTAAATNPTISVSYNLLTIGASTAIYQTAADKTGGFFAPNAATAVSYVNGTTVSQYGTAATLGTSRHVAVDGANTAWVTDRASSGVSQLTTGGTFLSPFTTTNGTTTTGSVGFVHTGITTGVNGIAIDPSGNVWLPTANQTSAAPASNYSVFELVGAAAPTVTPLALALKNTSVGSRP